MPGLIRGVARTAVIAGTATAVSNNVSRRQGNRWAQQNAAPAQEPPPPPPQQPPPQQYAPAPQQPQAEPVPDDDMYTQLERLGALRSAGILTEEEFAAQKARILAG